MRNVDETSLHNNAWLSELPDAAKSELISVAKIRQYAKNESVHQKGGKAGGLYGLISGEIRVSASTFSGEEIVFTRLLPGQWFGEIAVLDGGVRTHDSHTVSASKIAILPRAAILDVCRRHPQVHAALVTLLCEHCRLAFSAIDEFLVYSSEQRMAGRLLELAPKGGNLKVHISQSDLGGLVGISRQSTNKILKRWESKNWIKRVYGGVKICNLDALEDLQ